MGFFKDLFYSMIPATCSIPDENREWIDDSFIWFAKEFGLDLIRAGATITPTPQFFPNVYTASQTDAEKLVRKVCEWMRIDPQWVNLLFFEAYKISKGKGREGREGESKWATGLYFKKKGSNEFILAIDKNMIADPVVLVATIAHELSHAHLIGSGRVKAKEKDQEFLTDLLAIYFGLGIFIANAAFNFSQWDNGYMHGWRTSRYGYLPEPMIAYALALYALVREESDPFWARYLTYNVKVLFRRSLKYLSIIDRKHLSQLIPYTDR